MAFPSPGQCPQCGLHMPFQTAWAPGTKQPVARAENVRTDQKTCMLAVHVQMGCGLSAFEAFAGTKEEFTHADHIYESQFHQKRGSNEQFDDARSQSRGQMAVMCLLGGSLRQPLHCLIPLERCLAEPVLAPPDDGLAEGLRQAYQHLELQTEACAP